MNKIVVFILVISIIGNLIGAFALYKYFAAKRSIGYVKQDLERANKALEDLTGVLDRQHDKRMVFLHHSVGRGILYEGGLRDSLLEMGIVVKGATYGDEIGQHTDIKDWVPKFQNDMERILSFKAHPDRYYSGSLSNDVVMFKSCFPNSDIIGEGQAPGNPVDPDKTIANYKAVFRQLKKEIAQHPDKLYIYVTSPPLVPESTTAENAGRAREFNEWLVKEYLPEYQKETGRSNLAVFDLFDVMADDNGFLKQEYRRPAQGDSHPNAAANQVAAASFMSFFKPLWTKWENGGQGTTYSSR